MSAEEIDTKPEMVRDWEGKKNDILDNPAKYTKYAGAAYGLYEAWQEGTGVWDGIKKMAGYAVAAWASTKFVSWMGSKIMPDLVEKEATAQTTETPAAEPVKEVTVKTKEETPKPKTTETTKEIDTTPVAENSNLNTALEQANSKHGEALANLQSAMDGKEGTNLSEAVRLEEETRIAADKLETGDTAKSDDQDASKAAEEYRALKREVLALEKAEIPDIEAITKAQENLKLASSAYISAPTLTKKEAGLEDSKTNELG